jgi:hypothetical protein
MLSRRSFSAIVGNIFHASKRIGMHFGFGGVEQIFYELNEFYGTLLDIWDINNAHVVPIRNQLPGRIAS